MEIANFIGCINNFVFMDFKFPKQFIIYYYYTFERAEFLCYKYINIFTPLYFNN